MERLKKLSLEEQYQLARLAIQRYFICYEMDDVASMDYLTANMSYDIHKPWQSSQQ